MRCYLSAIFVLIALVAYSIAAPMPQSDQGSSVDLSTQTTQIVNTFNQKVALLRRYCPQIFQVIDNVIANVTSTAFRVIGRVLLQNGGLGGGGGGGGAAGTGRVSVVLPDFGDDDDDEDDEEYNDTAADGSSSTSTTASSVVTASVSSSASSTAETTTAPPLPLAAVEASSSSASSASVASSTEAMAAAGGADSASTDNRITDADDDDTDGVELKITDARGNALTATNEVDSVVGGGALPAPEEGLPLFTSPASVQVDVNDIRVRERRAADDDQTAAESGAAVAAPNPADDLAALEDDADRDKRYLPFGGSVSGSAHAGSGGGSGNFLFDIIRRTADGAARAAGTMFRLIAGTQTENVNLGLTATATSTRSLPQLVAGSGATEHTDEAENAPLGAGGVAEIDVAKTGDAYTEGVPGPITRLFVLANRGLANLVQDLILRLAQTSERIVNFKARLVTALI